MSNSSSSSTSYPPLAGPVLWLVRLAWVLGVSAYVGLYCLDLPSRWFELNSSFGSIQWQTILTQSGLTNELASGYWLGIDMAAVTASVAMAALMMWRKSQDRVVVLFSFTLVAFGISAGTVALMKGWNTPPAWGLVLDAASSLGFTLALLTLCVVPDGRFAPRWTATFITLWSVWMLVGLAFPEISFFRGRGDGLPNTPGGYTFFIIIQGIVFGVGLAAQIYRYNRISTPLQRQQTKWVLFGMVLVLAGYMLDRFLAISFPILNEPGIPGLAYRLAIRPVAYYLPRLLLPVFLVIAVLRHRLLDIDALINRSLVYTALTSAIIAIYLLGIAVFQYMFRATIGQAPDLAVVFATICVAILFRPLQRYLQSGIDRLFYREKIDFQRAFRAFTREVRHYVDLPELLNVLVYRLADLFHSSWAAVYLPDAGSGIFHLAQARDLPPELTVLLMDEDQLRHLHIGEPVIRPQHGAFALLVPLIALWADRRELVGVLALGPKLSEAPYGREDLAQLTTLVDEAGTAISLAQAVTERQRAIEERQAAVAQQLELEKHSRRQAANNETILNNIADGVLVLDLDGKFLTSNPALFHMIPEPDLKEIIARPLEKTIQWRRKVFAVTIAPVPEVGTVAVFRDETRRREMERAKDAMLATASHELRTPLAATMNYIELLLMLTKMGRIDSAQFGEHLERALETSRRLERLVTNILDRAQIQAGLLELKNQAFDLPVLLERSRQLLDVLIKQKGLSYQLSIDPDVPSEVVGDAERLHQVLVNLLGNAIKFTEQGGIRVAVRNKGPEKLSIEVADTGPGIPPEQLPDIFEPFRRSSDYAQREHQGAGLGLSIAKEIITRMGGEISVSSEPGAGSVFTISIPVEGAPA